MENESNVDGANKTLVKVWLWIEIVFFRVFTPAVQNGFRVSVQLKHGRT